MWKISTCLLKKLIKIALFMKIFVEHYSAGLLLLRYQVISCFFSILLQSFFVFLDSLNCLWVLKQKVIIKILHDIQLPWQSFIDGVNSLRISSFLVFNFYLFVEEINSSLLRRQMAHNPFLCKLLVAKIFLLVYLSSMICF